MSPSYGFGGTSRLGAWTGAWVQSYGIGLPVGRTMFSGSQAAQVVALHGYAAGRGAARTCTLNLGSFGATSSVGAAGAAASTGWFYGGAWLVAGGSATFTITCSGSFWYGRGEGANNTVDNDGLSMSGTLGGGVIYVQAPIAPGTPTLTSPLPGKAKATWDAPGDNGESAITGYRLQYATNSTFTAGVGVIELGNVNTHEWAVASGATKLWVRVFAKNAVTNAAGSTSQPSAASSVEILAGGRRWDGAAEVPTAVASRWDGVKEVQFTTAVRWDGTNEVPLT